MAVSLSDRGDEEPDPDVTRSSEPQGPPRAAMIPHFPEHGPEWPPTDEQRARALAGDAWVHPLRGPARRMPLRPSRAFGAPRPGDRPRECRAGHCGIDIGGDEWGEPILAIRGGTVERVERSPAANGGRYVWLRHKGGDVRSHYFHLAAIPPGLEEGDRVDRGQRIGLLGASGVEHSGPHLHFAIAMRFPGEDRHRYIDPEPLLAMWPLEIPVACETESRISGGVPPGPVVGAHRGAPTRVAEGDTRQDDEDEAEPEGEATADDTSG